MGSLSFTFHSDWLEILALTVSLFQLPETFISDPGSPQPHIATSLFCCKTILSPITAGSFICPKEGIVNIHTINEILILKTDFMIYNF